MFLLGVFFTLACVLAVIVVISVYEPDPDDPGPAEE